MMDGYVRLDGVIIMKLVPIENWMKYNGIELMDTNEIWTIIFI